MHQNTRTSAEVVKTWLTAAFFGLSLPGCMRMSEAERRELRISAKDAREWHFYSGMLALISCAAIFYGSIVFDVFPKEFLLFGCLC